MIAGADRPGAASAAIAGDAKDLHRGVIVNAFGTILKIAYPAALVLVVRLYGAETYGVFAVLQAIYLLAVRLVLLGFDKALLWWTARHEAADERSAIRPALRAVTVLGGGTALVLAIAAAPAVAAWSGVPGASLSVRLMALGLVPLAMMELLVHAALGKRRMEAQIFVREGSVSAALVASALVFRLFGLAVPGLALAFVVSAFVGLGGSVWMFARTFRRSAWPIEGPWPPREFVRYALPMGLSELSTSLLSRLDLWVVAALTDPRAVGIYAAATQVGGAVRAVRRSFDPIVLALMSRVSARHDRERLVAGFSHATVLVIASQMPVFAFLFAFASWLMPLFGPGFEAGTPVVLVLCGFWTLNGAIGLNGMVISGYGRSDLVLVNVIFAIAVEASALLLLIPRYGLVGAAWAVGLAYTLQNVLQMLETRKLTGSFCYNRDVLAVILAGALCAAVMAAAWFALEPMGEGVRRIGSFVVYIIAAGLAALWLQRTGRLFGPPRESRKEPA